MNEIINYNLTDAEIKSLALQYSNVPDPFDDSGFKEIKAALRDLQKIRKRIEDHRKELKADALEWSRKVDSTAREIREKIEKIEAPYKAAKAKREEAERREAERKAELERRRIAEIKERIETMKTIPLDCIGGTVADMETAYKTVCSFFVDPVSFGEFTSEARTIQDVSKKTLETMITTAKEAAAREAEIARREAELEKAEAEQKKAQHETEPEPEPAELQPSNDINHPEQKTPENGAQGAKKDSSSKLEADETFNMLRLIIKKAFYDRGLSRSETLESIIYDAAEFLFLEIKAGNVKNVNYTN